LLTDFSNDNAITFTIKEVQRIEESLNAHSVYKKQITKRAVLSEGIPQRYETEQDYQ